MANETTVRGSMRTAATVRHLVSLVWLLGLMPVGCDGAAADVETQRDRQVSAVIPAPSYGLAGSRRIYKYWPRPAPTLIEFGAIDESCPDPYNLAVDTQGRLYVGDLQQRVATMTCASGVCSCRAYAKLPGNTSGLAVMNIAQRQRLVAVGYANVWVYDEDARTWQTFATDWTPEGDLTDGGDHRYAAAQDSRLVTLSSSWHASSIGETGPQPFGISAASRSLINTWSRNGEIWLFDLQADTNELQMSTEESWYDAASSPTPSCYRTADCASGLTCCKTGCVDLKSSVENCGACGNSCGPFSCDNGACSG